jgi:DNA-binding NarL/FixJ family response regulator
MDYFAHSSVAPANPAAFSDLSVQEREVLTLIAQGLTNAAIAERLVLSPKTVRNYNSEIYSKLQVADLVQAILRAREADLG